MKKYIAIAAVTVIALIVGAFAIVGTEKNSYIRIHIRANSNSEYDQSVKYTVKDSVVEAITPLAEDITDKESMYKVLENNLTIIKAAADRKLGELGVNYRANIRLCREKFPTRTYDDLTLTGGVYDALIIELGEGVGDNWWCVAFPPLCFVGEKMDGKKVEYRSKLYQLFNSKR